MADSNQSIAEAHDEQQHAGKRPGHSRKAWLWFAVLVLIAALAVIFFGWLPRHRRSQKIEQDAKARSQEKPRVQVYIVRRAPSSSELMVPGTTLAYTEAYIYARASGYVRKRFVDIGDRVHAGQLLATIDAPDFDQQVAQARSILQQSESNLVQMQAQLHVNALNWDRYKVLVAKGVFSRQQGDEQEANFRVAEANVRAAENTVQGNRENLQRLIVLQQYERVTAPFNGVITARNVDVGALITAQGTGLGVSSTTSSPGTTGAGAKGNNQGAGGNLTAQTNPQTGGSQGGEMFGIANTDTLRVLVSVPETYSSAIHNGQRAELFFQELSNQRFEGRVARTSASIDQNTRTLLVEVQVANHRRVLLPGMYTVVNFIDVRGERPLVIPGEAIVIRNAKTTIALASNNRIHFQPITIGRDYGDQSEILSGLKEGDVIATTVTDEIHEGAKIEPQYPKQQAQSQPGGQSDQQESQSGQYGDQGLDNKAQKSTAKSGGSKGGSGKSNSGKPSSSAKPGAK